SLGYEFGPSRRRGPGTSAEYHQIQQRVSHQTIAPMETARGFPRDKQIPHPGLPVHIDLNPAVLIVEGGIRQHRVLRNVDAIPLVLAHHGREMLFHRARSLLHVKQWSRSEEHTSELQSRVDLVCRLLLEK